MAIKSLLTASVLGVISAAVSGIAFADTFADTGMSSTYCKPGFYSGVQGGRSDTFYNPTDLLFEASHNHVGTNAKTNYNPITGAVSSTVTTTTTSSLAGQDVDDVGLGGRIYAGYQFNPYFAVEAGFTQFGKTDVSATGTATSVVQSVIRSSQSENSTAVTTDTVQYSGGVTEHAIDLVAKGTLPLQYGFGLYAKAGMAYIQADRHINSNNVGPETTLNYNANGALTNSAATISDYANNSTINAQTYQGFRPVAGVGVNYTIPCTNLSVDASYTRIFSYGAIPNAKLAALGLEYKFA